MKSSDISWFWAVLPFNAALEGIVILIPLYILQLGGTVVDVGLAAAAWSSALILGSILWGFMIDKYHLRKSVLLITYLTCALVLFTFYFASSMIMLLTLYAAYSFLTAAITPAVNLLLIETSPKAAWPKMFAKLSSFSNYGLALGAAPGVIWSSFFALRDYFILLALFTLMSLILAERLIYDPLVTLEMKTLLHVPESFYRRILHVPHHRHLAFHFSFIKAFHVANLRTFSRMLFSSLTRDVPLLYSSIALFTLGAGVFFTAYIPFLKESLLSDGEIFLVNLYFILLSAFAFSFSGRFTESHGEVRTVILSLIGRSVAMILASILAAFAKGFTVLAGTIIIFTILGVTWALYNTASSLLILKTSPQGRHGEFLGIYSAMTGAALLVASLAAGYLPFHFGFPLTYTVACISFLTSFFIVSIGRLGLSPQKGR